MSIEKSPSSYWLYRWFGENGLYTLAQLSQALDSRKLLTSLHEAASAARDPLVVGSSECNLVAGSGLGQYNGLSCTNPSCRADHIENIFRHAWHYFDRTLVPDAPGDFLRSRELSKLDDRAIKALIRLIGTAVYLRDIGAENLVAFYSSTGLSSELFKPKDSFQWEALWTQFEKDLLNDAEGYRFSPAIKSNSMVVKYLDLKLKFQQSLELNLKTVPKRERKLFATEVLAREMTERHRRAVEGDIAVAQALNSSIGSTMWSHKYVFDRLKDETHEGQIFFNMSFPTLENVPISELIALRECEGDSFLAFRGALRKAARELSTSKTVDRQETADTLVKDIVFPEAARLEKKLNAAKVVLAKKSAIALSVGAVSTWCGIHFGLGAPAAIGAGTLASLASGLKDAASKYSEERRDLDIADMSFVWKALHCKRKQ